MTVPKFVVVQLSDKQWIVAKLGLSNNNYQKLAMTTSQSSAERICKALSKSE